MPIIDLSGKNFIITLLLLIPKFTAVKAPDAFVNITIPCFNSYPPKLAYTPGVPAK